MKSLQLNVITHIHTKASNGPASSLDQMAKSILTDIFGSIPEGLVWRECFTDTEDLLQILSGKRTGNPIDIVLLTDHMSSRHHILDKDLQHLAVEDRRVGLGCEIQTVRYSEKRGRFLTAPEVLLYGDGKNRFFNGQPYTGVDNLMLERLYEACTLPGSSEPEISRVNAFCKENLIACALAHPFDCQQLDLEETLDVIGSFTFIETVNGGFPRRSAEALQEYVAFHNTVLQHDLAHALLAKEWTDEQQQRLKKISRSHLLVQLGGSDAHLNNFDRVITRFRTVAGKTNAVDFISTLLACPASEILKAKILEPVGKGVSMPGLYRDVVGIVGKNIRVYRRHFSRPSIWPALVRALTTTGAKELKVRVVRNKSIASEYRDRLDIPTLQKAATLLCTEKKHHTEVQDTGYDNVKHQSWQVDVNSFAMPRYTLLCPGPVNVGTRVAEAYSRCALSHREDSFSTLLCEVQRDLLFIAGVRNTEAYSALVITGSGTAANEAVLTSAVPPDAVVVVLSNGEFGERLAGISKTYNSTEVISSEWGEELDLVQLEKRLADNSRVLVAMVHHETSTGLLNPIEQVGRLCKRYGVQLFVDAVSSFAADPILMEESGITFLSTSSGKAIASYPGLSIVLGRNEDLSRIGEYPVKNHYLNLYRYFQALTEDRQTPNTPAVSLVVTLHESLREICSEGFNQRYLRLCELASYMRSQLAARGLYKPVEKPQSVILTNAYLPQKMTFADLQQGLKKKGFVIYDAKGPLKGRFFQVSIIGDITITDIDRFFLAFDSV